MIGNTLTNNGINAYSLEGGTFGSTTWQSTNTAYVLIGDVIVGGGSTLTINPGVVVKFTGGKALVVDGSLRVMGTSTNKVYFTSFQDDTLKGDSNNDGSSSAPLPGNWNSILFRDSSNDVNSLINYAEIRYAGAYVDIGNYYDWYGLKYPYLGGITLINASPTIQNATIKNNQYRAITGFGNSNPVMSGNTLTNNGINAYSLDGGTIGSTTWQSTNTAYVLLNDVIVGGGSTLTINPGVVIKENNGAALVVDGSLRILGTSTSKVYFTSFQDDTLRGDSNNDGASSAPLPGNWRTILFRDSSNDVNSLINYAEIRYAGAYVDIGGYYDWYGLKYPTLGGITLINASPAIRNSLFIRNAYRGIALTNSNPVLGCNNFINNPDYAVFNDTPGNIVNFTNQYWGSANGPNLSGGSNKVSTGISYRPWRTLECKYQMAAYYSLGAEDGFVTESSETSSKGGVFNAVTQAIRLGDTATKAQYRLILSFDTSLLPDNAVISSATLRIKQYGLPVGSNPILTFGNLYADLMKGAFGGNNSLAAADFQATASTAQAGFFGKTPSGGWYTAAIKSGLTNINKTGRTQFRLRFATDDNNNAIADYINFYSGNTATTAFRPTLTITYYLP